MNSVVRRGLSESLESYAERCGASASDFGVRGSWRIGGLVALGFGAIVASDAVLGGLAICRIAPGLSVPTPPAKLSPA